jgi:hypothetical protein
VPARLSQRGPSPDFLGDSSPSGPRDCGNVSGQKPFNVDRGLAAGLLTRARRVKGAGKIFSPTWGLHKVLSVKESSRCR